MYSGLFPQSQSNWLKLTSASFVNYVSGAARNSLTSLADSLIDLFDYTKKNNIINKKIKKLQI